MSHRPDWMPTRGGRVGVASVRLGTACLALSMAPAGIWGQEVTTTQIARQIQSEQALDLSVRFFAGSARLSPTGTRTLYSMRLTYDPQRVQPIHEYRSGVAVLGAEPVGSGPFLRRGRIGTELDVTVTNQIPVGLSLELGAVEAAIDLGGIRLTALSIEAGASESELRVSALNPEQLAVANIRVGAADFQATDLGNLNAEELRVTGGVGSVVLDFGELRRDRTRLLVQFGLGSLEVRVPRDVGVRLERDTFLSSVSAPGFVTRDGALQSPNWDQAARFVEIEVDAGLASIAVVRTNP